MKRKSKTGLWLLLFLVYSQLAIASTADTLLSVTEYLQLVRSFHPIAKKAAIQVSQAGMQILQAKALFDPMLAAGTSNKTLGGTSYYNTQQLQLTIPTWYGIEFKTGLEHWNGDRLNPEETLGMLQYAGVQIPLLKNLLYDKRRAALQQSKQMELMAKQDQQVILNELYSDALNAYLDWVQAYELWQLAKRNLNLSINRMSFVRRSFELGDRAAIDTLEAYTQVQQFELLFNQRYLEFIRESIYLSAYLWNERSEPLALKSNCIPSNEWKLFAEAWTQQTNLDSLCSALHRSHPSLRWYDQKLNVLALDRKVKFQDLLPKLDLQYNLLSKKGWSGFNPSYDGFSPAGNSYFGLKFQYSLRVSEGRANYQMAKLKIKDATLDRDLKKLDLENKVKKYLNDYLLISKQVGLQTNYVTNLSLLASAEQKKLELGESSFFLTNSRDNKVLEANEKLIQLEIKRKSSLLGIPYALGMLQTVIQ